MPLDCVECGRRAVRVAIVVSDTERSDAGQNEKGRWCEEKERVEVETWRVASGAPRLARGRRLPGKFWEKRDVPVLFLGLYGDGGRVR